MKPILIFLLLISQVAFAQNGVAYLGGAIGVDRAVEESDLEVLEEEPAIAYTTFDLVGGMILADAKLDGERGYFVLDTGAPGLVINSSDFEPSSTITASGINGAARMGTRTINDFTWAGVKHQRLEAQLMDLSCFEKISHKKIKGLIGYQFLKGKELRIDYKGKVIRLVKSVQLPEEFSDTGQNVNFRYLEHLPVVKMKINGKVGYFGLDTGSEVNILHSRWAKKVKSKRSVNVGQLVGVDGEALAAKKIWVESVVIDKMPLEQMAFFMIDLSPIENDYGVQLDGILGFPFFSQNEVALNFEEQQLSFR